MALCEAEDIIYASTQDTFGVVQIVVEHSEFKYHMPMTLTRLGEISPLKRYHGQHVINTKKYSVWKKTK